MLALLGDDIISDMSDNKESLACRGSAGSSPAQEDSADACAGSAVQRVLEWIERWMAENRVKAGATLPTEIEIA